jgi:hypothetical protein
MTSDYQVLTSTVSFVKSTKNGVASYQIVGSEFAGVVDEKCPVRGCVVAQRAKIGISLVIGRTASLAQARKYVKNFRAIGGVATVSATALI